MGRDGAGWAAPSRPLERPPVAALTRPLARRGCGASGVAGDVDQIGEDAVGGLLEAGMQAEDAEIAHQVRMQQEHVGSARDLREEVEPSSTSARTRSETPCGVRLPRATSAIRLPERSASATFCGVRRPMPRRLTAAGVVRASISTLASAAALQALSQPSMSNQGSASATPRRRASAMPSSSGAAPHRVEDHLRGQFEHAGKAEHAHAGQGCRARLKTGVPSITVLSKRNPTPERRASSASSA